MWSQDYKLVFRSLPQLSRRLSCSILRTCVELLPSIEKSKSTIVVLPLNPFCIEGIIQRWKKWAANFFACFGSLKHFTALAQLKFRLLRHEYFWAQLLRPQLWLPGLSTFMLLCILAWFQSRWPSLPCLFLYLNWWIVVIYIILTQTFLANWQ